MILSRFWAELFRTLSLVRGQVYSIHPEMSFQAERTVMSKNWKNERRKYVDIEATPEGLKYYGIVDGQRIEVSKEVYLVLEHSYHKEFKMDCERFDENHISLDALLEEIDDYDKHNTVPSAFISKSAEQDYFDSLESSDENMIPEIIVPEFNQLDEQEKQMLLTYRNRESVVKQVSIQGKRTSKRTTQRRRKEIADKVRIAYEERVKNNE